MHFESFPKKKKKEKKKCNLTVVKLAVQVIILRFLVVTVKAVKQLFHLFSNELNFFKAEEILKWSLSLFQG